MEKATGKMNNKSSRKEVKVAIDCEQEGASKKEREEDTRRRSTTRRHNMRRISRLSRRLESESGIIAVPDLALGRQGRGLGRERDRDEGNESEQTQRSTHRVG